MDLIIGAGISGLSYANFCGHDDYLIIERDTSIGGYCKTVKKNGFTWDYSGHFFHFRDEKIKEYLLKGMNEDSIIYATKHTQIRYKDRYIDFPFQKNIHQLSKKEFIDCLYHLFYDREQTYSNFREMVMSKFGKSIAEKFLIPYNEKLYATDLNKLDENAMGRFFPYADKEEIIRNFKYQDNSSYNASFSYPQGGAIEYVNSLFKRVDPSKVFLNEKILKIDIKNRIATTMKRRIRYDRLISTIPFPILLDITGTNYDKELYSWNKVLVLNLGFNKKGDDTVNNWVYFPEKKYSFYRVGYYDNIFNTNRLSLYVELGFSKDEKIDFNKSLDIVIADLRKAKIIKDHKLVAYHSVIMDPAYVHISRKSEKDKVRKMKILAEDNIYSIGRYGEWTYCSIEDNILQAQKLISFI